jgi:predicted Zn-dependent peptidase
VACKNRKKAVDAIFEEFKILCQKPVPVEELEMVKNYMMGELLRNFDGPFSTADIYRNLQEFDLNFEFYKKMIEFLKQVTPMQLQELAKKYLKPDDFWVVVAGK